MQPTLENFTIVNGLNMLAAEVRRTWLPDDYPAEYRSSFAQFRNAAVHAAKAIGQIMALIDLVEHQSESDELGFLNAKLPKLLGDMVRCAAHMADNAPFAQIRLSSACVDRAEQLAKRWNHEEKKER